MSAPAITPESVVAVSAAQVASELDGETVVLSMQDGRYYGLDGVAARVWSLVQGPVRVADVCAAIVAEYDVAPARCEADVLAFLQRLAESGLLEVRPGA